MRRFITPPLALAAALSLAACESQAEQDADAVEDAIEQEADASAAAAGTEEAALGLSEGQLLEADLVAADGTDLGDIEQVRRNAAGAVEGLLVEIEDSDPERYVVVPIDGLTTRADGADTDLQASMTAEELAGLPDAELDTITPAAEPMAQ